jgi:hypothetical protein
MLSFARRWAGALGGLNAISSHRKEHGMSKVIAIMSMSLDGYVADLNDDVAEVFDWYFNSGDVQRSYAEETVKDL